MCCALLLHFHVGELLTRRLSYSGYSYQLASRQVMCSRRDSCRLGATLPCPRSCEKSLPRYICALLTISEPCVSIIRSESVCDDRKAVTVPRLDLAAAWSVMLMFDVVVFSITFTQAIRINRLESQSLARRMLTDGAW